MSRWEHTNNGNNLDLMVSVRPELGKNDISGHALITMQKFIESLDYKPISEDNLKHGFKNKKVIEPTHINVKDLITVYKWPYQLCHMAMFLPIFTDIIENDRVKIEDVPQFDKLMYKVMGE